MFLLGDGSQGRNHICATMCLGTCFTVSDVRWGTLRSNMPERFSHVAFFFLLIKERTFVTELHHCLRTHVLARDVGRRDACPSSGRWIEHPGDKLHLYGLYILVVRLRPLRYVSGLARWHYQGTALIKTGHISLGPSHTSFTLDDSPAHNTSMQSSCLLSLFP
jgi:hypothetical protein